MLVQSIVRWTIRSEFSPVAGGKSVAYIANLLKKPCQKCWPHAVTMWSVVHPAVGFDKCVKGFPVVLRTSCIYSRKRVQFCSFLEHTSCTTAYFHLSVLTGQSLRCVDPCCQHVRLFLVFVRHNKRPGQQSALVEQSWGERTRRSCCQTVREFMKFT